MSPVPGEYRRARFNWFHIVMPWNRENPTTSRDDIIDIARSLVRPAR
nr:hypothetical protein [Rhizobium changzhiense]